MELESLIRNVVQEEMEQAKERVIVSVLKALELVNQRASLNHHIETKQGIGYQLLFANKLPSTIYTDTKIESEIGGPIKIELVDTTSKAIVTSGPLSSMKIQTVVLDGNLGFEDKECWTEQEFDDKVVKERKDRRPLVIGDLDIALKDGVGIISDLSFTDNSKWTKSGTFRLGARVAQSNDGQVRIKEATSEAFRVKESRAKVYKKHHPPSLDDDVWRLENIAKNGKYHMRLAGHHIVKVKDFMQMYNDSPSKLKNILKCSYRLLEEIAQHASKYVLYDDKPNAVDGQNYQPPAKRSCIQKPLVGSRKEQSYKNVNNFYPVDGSSIFGQSNPLTNLQAEPISNTTTAFSGLHMGDYHASTLSSYKDGLGDHNHLLQLPEAQDTHLIQPFDPMCGNYNIGIDGLLATCNEENVPNLVHGMTPQAPMPHCRSVNALWSHSDGYNLPWTSNYSEPNFISSTIQSPVNTTSERDFFYSHIRSPGNEELELPFFPHPFPW